MSKTATLAKQQMKDVITSAINKAIQNGALPEGDIPEFIIEKPADKSNGDLATNCALVSAKTFRMPPFKIAQAITENIDLEGTLFTKFETAGPGFINFFLSQSYYSKVLKEVEEEKENFGQSNYGQGEKVMVEFVSANPTGPMHMGNARGGAYGDSLARIMSFCGYDVTKEYYLNDKLVYTENKFDSRIEYTFISNDLNKEHVCPNCSAVFKCSDNNYSCPYCGTYYNIDYIDKDLGGKYHYDRVLRSNKYRIITWIVDIIICLILTYIFIKNTSRTFNEYDISKIFIYGGILSLILYYFFYILDAYLVLGPIKRYKDKINQKQIEFWNRTKIDKKKFFNNLNFEIRKKYYSNPNIIDYDIIDYDDFSEYTKNDILYVKVDVYVRIVEFKDNKIISNYKVDNFVLKKVNKNTLENNGDLNIIKCSNCGASVDVLKGECEYCHTIIKAIQEWVIDE